MKRLAFLNLTGISGQIAALVVASIIAIHLILTATFLVYRPDEAPIDRGHTQLVAVVQLLGAAPTAERPRLLADIARAFPQLDIGSLPPGPAAANESADSELRSLHRRLGSNYRIFSLPHEQDAPKAGIALPDGAMISVSTAMSTYGAAPTRQAAPAARSNIQAGISSHRPVARPERLQRKISLPAFSTTS